MKCKLCEALTMEKDKFLYQDSDIIILPTKDLKGHHKRIMIVSKKHTTYILDEHDYLQFFKEWCSEYFNEEPTFAIVESTFATIPDHWHKIACDWFCTPDELIQMHYTPHIAYSTDVKWKPTDFKEYEYGRWCRDCIHKDKPKPNPCMSCEQEPPSNYEEE